MLPKLFRIEALSSDNRLLFKSSVGEDVDVSLASRFEPELEEESETEPELEEESETEPELEVEASFLTELDDCDFS